MQGTKKRFRSAVMAAALALPMLTPIGAVPAHAQYQNGNRNQYRDQNQNQRQYQGNHSNFYNGAYNSGRGRKLRV